MTEPAVMHGLGLCFESGFEQKPTVRACSKLRGRTQQINSGRSATMPEHKVHARQPAPVRDHVIRDPVFTSERGYGPALQQTRIDGLFHFPGIVADHKVLPKEQGVALTT